MKLDSKTKNWVPKQIYDPAGRLTTTGAASFSYDAAGRMATATTGGATTTYAYDGDGARIRSASPTSTTDYRWDTNHPVAQVAFERTGAASTTHTYGQGRIASATGANRSYYLTDALGSVVATTTGAGSTGWSYSYGGFGEPRPATRLDPAAAPSAYRYAGEYLDAGGLYHLRARQYDPTTGRFGARDPLGAPADEPYVSAYAYVANRPTVAVDPTGMRGQRPPGSNRRIIDMLEGDGDSLVGDGLRPPGDLRGRPRTRGTIGGIAIAGGTIAGIGTLAGGGAHGGDDDLFLPAEHGT